MSDGLVGLSLAIEALRQELEDAVEAGKGRSVGFRVGEVTLTLEAVAQKEKGGGGKLRWWIVEAGGEAKASQAVTQTLVVSLTPHWRDAKGTSAPLDVKGRQSAPGD